MTQPTEFLKRINAALALREIPDNEAALIQLEKAINLSPQDAYVHLLIGQTYEELEKFNEAESSFRQALAYQPDLFEAQQSLGIILVKNDKYNEAISALEPLVDADPGNETIVEALATAYEKVDDFDRSIQVLRAAIGLNNDRVSLLRRLANILAHNKGDLVGAVQVIDQALTIKRSSSLLNLRGIFVALQRKEGEAIPYFEEAIAINQKNIPAFRNLAQAYLAINEIEKAIEVANRGLILYPDSEMLLFTKAKILRDLGRFDEEVTILEKLISDTGRRERHIIEYYVTLLRLGRIDQAFNVLLKEYQSVSDEQKEDLIKNIENAGVNLFQERRVNESKQLFEHVLQISLEKARSINNLGFILICERSWRDADVLLQRAEKEGYEFSPILKANQGYIALNRNESQKAIELLNKALEGLEETNVEEGISALLHVAYPWVDGLVENRIDDYPTRYIFVKTIVLLNLACAHYLIGNIEQALTFAQQAIENDPEECTGYRMLGCLNFILGDFEQARKAWEKALESSIQEEATVVREWLDLLEK